MYNKKKSSIELFKKKKKEKEKTRLGTEVGMRKFSAAVKTSKAPAQALQL